MEKFEFIIEKGKDGDSAFRHEADGSFVCTRGDGVAETRTNAVESYNLYAEEVGLPVITIDQVTFKYDVKLLFDFYKEINVAALGRRIGMHKSLLSEYRKGTKTPSADQLNRILTGIKDLGKELSELELV